MNHVRFREESVSMERLDGELILINFETGRYFSLRESAADVAWLIQNSVERSNWSSILASVFPGLVWSEKHEEEVDTFISFLQDFGLIEEADIAGGQPPSLPEDYLRTGWSTPTIVHNDDLADLLLIDPIHNTSIEGWPDPRST